MGFNLDLALEVLRRPPATWRALLAGVSEPWARGPAAPWPPSRVFGRISGASWGVMEHKHLDHHLRQFGV